MLEIEKVQPPLEDFLKRFLHAGRFHLSFRIEPAQGPGEGSSQEDAPAVMVLFDGEDADLLLARGGEMLAALEHLAAKVLRLSAEEQNLLVFDCHDYRSLRVEELRLTAETAAERVERTGQPFALSPMNSRERRIVHLALKERPGVRTESDGAGPRRKVVIHPREKK
jgi:spoIIIJ-associated protein